MFCPNLVQLTSGRRTERLRKTAVDALPCYRVLISQAQDEQVTASRALERVDANHPSEEGGATWDHLNRERKPGQGPKKTQGQSRQEPKGHHSLPKTQLGQRRSWRCGSLVEGTLGVHGSLPEWRPVWWTGVGGRSKNRKCQTELSGGISRSGSRRFRGITGAEGVR